MGETRELFKKTGDAKGTFHASMGTIKERNSKELTEAVEIKNLQEHTEELYEKGLYDWDNHNSVVTHPEPDILECEVKWALGSIAVNKASGCDRIPAELFKTPRVMLSRCFIQYVNKSGRPSSGHRTRKSQSSSQFPNHWTIALISHASKVMLNILNARLQPYANQKLSDVRAGFRKGRETRDQITNICWITEKAREVQKNICLFH